MLTFITGVVVGVVLASLGILTLPKLKTLWVAILAKFAKAPVVTSVTTPAPANTPTNTPAP